MKFEAEDPAEVSKAGSGRVDRSQGAARAISVCASLLLCCSLPTGSNSHSSIQD